METLAYLQAVRDENSEQELNLENFKLSGKLTGIMLGAAGAALAVGAAQAPAQAYGYGGGYDYGGYDHGCYDYCGVSLSSPKFLGGGYQVTSYKTYDVSFNGCYDHCGGGGYVSSGCYDDCGYSYPVSYGCYDHCGISYPSSGGCYDDCGYGGYGGHEISYGGGCYDDCGYGISYGGGYGGGCYDYCGVSYGGFSTYDIQSALNYAGFHIYVDGVYGPETHHAVVAFQLAVGLVPDGIVGPATASALGLY
ncbi:MAG: peptidoglycan-binding domain-containing protein [Elainella sp.]